MKNSDNDPYKKDKEALKAQGFVGEGIPGDGVTSVRVTKESDSVIRRVNERVQQLCRSDALTTRAQAGERALDEVVEEVEAGTKSFPDMVSYLRYMEEQGRLETVYFDPTHPHVKECIRSIFETPGRYIELHHIAEEIGSVIIYLNRDGDFKVLPYDPSVKIGGDEDDEDDEDERFKRFKERLEEVGFVPPYRNTYGNRGISVGHFFSSYLDKNLKKKKAQAEAERAASFPY